jgi:hypothetical protein
VFYRPTPAPLRRRLARAARRLAVAAATAVLDAVAEPTPAPVSLAVVPATPAAAPVPTLTPDEMPADDVIEAAAADFDEATELGRRADRGKRKARKLLDRLPAGVYGRATVEWIESNRETPDLTKIRADYARAGLGDVPMRPCASSLKVTMAPAVDAATVEVAAVAA